MAWQRYQNVSVPATKPPSLKRRYSVTADVLSFKLCPRQYGHFSVRGYVPAHAVQAFFGTIIHQVLDRAHAHFRGLVDPTTKGRLPTEQDIEGFYNEVEKALKARGIRALNKDLRDLALKLAKRFNEVEGPSLYPRVRDTEHRIQSDRGSFVLHGVVDVLADPSIGNPTANQMEIWDYKASRFPATDLQKRERFEYQMLVYAELYKARNGVYPAKAILYFMNELEGEPAPTKRPANAYHEVTIDPARIQKALADFGLTVQQIENCLTNDQWPPPPPKLTPGKETCDVCEIRWSCPSVSKYEMRYP